MTNDQTVCRKSYPTDLIDEQWSHIESLLPVAKPGGPTTQGEFARGTEHHSVSESNGLSVGHAAARPFTAKHNVEVFCGVARRWHASEDS